MSLTRLMVLSLALGGSGCATRYETGQALVAGGTVVAVAASEIATQGSRNCVDAGCFAWNGSTSRYSKEAAAGVGAGVAIAAIGAAIRDSDSPPEHRRKRAPQPDPDPE